jgi:hypothetical protein
MHQVRRNRSANFASSKRYFRYWAEQWLEYLGRLHRVVPDRPPFQKLIDSFEIYMADEQGLSLDSIKSYSRNTTKFLEWYWRQGRSFAKVKLQDVDEFHERQRVMEPPICFHCR